MMDVQFWKEKWQQEEQCAFEGWDFSQLQGRWHSEPLGWSYAQTIKARLRPAHSLLDMGTGGGEFLLTLGHPYGHTSVTEAWPPNVRLCEERLAPLGISVYPVTNHAGLPVPSGAFNMVINRHEAYFPKEVHRALKPGGVFITQQVGGKNCLALARRLNPGGVPRYTGHSLATELPKLQAAGLEVEYAEESYPALHFYDVGALVYWAKAIPWAFPDFSVENCFAQLCSLQQELEQAGAITATQHRFILVARKRS